MGVSGAWSQPEEDGSKDKAGAPIRNRDGGPRRVVWTRLKKTEAVTRPERLSSTNMGVPRRIAAALILNQYGGFRCVVSA